ncbi:prepilin peptidase [Candidatus Poriferisodalis sp.]|uniref:prepilin peptidase n=1 Tax=Candidatus Poriferisodalis sp. TaxID=3101277 RepID=UPI003B024394
MTMVVTELSIAAPAAAAAGLGGAAAGLVAVRCARRCFGVAAYPLPVVASCIAVAAIFALRLGHSAYLAPLLALAWAGVLISAIDLRTHLIPTRLLRACACAAVPLVCAAALADGGIAGLGRASVTAGLGSALGWATMRIVWRAARGGLGYGDVRLGAYLGLHLGLGGLAAVWTGLLAGFAIAAAVGGIGVVALGHSPDHRFALGPSLVAGALATAWWTVPSGLAA